MIYLCLFFVPSFAAVRNGMTVALELSFQLESSCLYPSQDSSEKRVDRIMSLTMMMKASKTSVGAHQ